VNNETSGPPKRALRIAVFAGLAIFCFWRLGSTPLFETDEGFAANRAASFHRHGTWRLSYDDVDDDNPQFRKPPLLYWAVATLYPVLGRNLWSVRLPGAAASLALCWLLYRIHRRHFDELTALGAVALFASVPFVGLHIRTAMLEMPLMALTFAAVYALAYLPEKRWSAAAAGLAAGGAVLLKGGAGFLVIAVAVLHAFLMNGFCARSFRRAVMALTATALVFAAYALLVVPDAWRDAMLTSMFVKEGARRTIERAFVHRFGAVWRPLWDTAPALIVLSVPGLAIALARWRAGGARWLGLMLLVCVPVLWAGTRQVVPYSRYFLPLFPFLAALAALSIAAVLRNRTAAGVAMLAVVAVVFFRTPAAFGRHPPPHEMPVDGMKELAGRLPQLVPEGGSVVLCAGKTKCHQLLFYGGRAVWSINRWLTDHYAPGDERILLVRRGYGVDVPVLSLRKIAEAGEFELFRAKIAPERDDVERVIVCKPEKVSETVARLEQEGRSVVPFDRGVLLLKSK
jgi:4-amino-4-deoxy-L-arabinose transferase-like glycosyltransferase